MPDLTVNTGETAANGKTDELEYAEQNPLLSSADAQGVMNC
jgi:hypothetical protein